MIELSLKTDFSRGERMLQLLAGRQASYAAARALNEVARTVTKEINARMGETFDRPTTFTQRAVVAPRALAATPDNPVAVVTVRPLQAKYLEPEERGGTRTAASNTRKPGSALVLPGAAMRLNQFGNIPSGMLRRLAAQAQRSGGKIAFLPAGAPGNKAGIGGYFRRGRNHTLNRLSVFEAATHYAPRFHFHDRVSSIARALFPAAFRRALSEALRTAR